MLINLVLLKTDSSKYYFYLYQNYVKIIRSHLISFSNIKY